MIANYYKRLFIKLFLCLFRIVRVELLNPLLNHFYLPTTSVKEDKPSCNSSYYLSQNSSSPFWIGLLRIQTNQNSSTRDITNDH
jgi:hypothetical protein